jgi:hypothetical protein
MIDILNNCSAQYSLLGCCHPRQNCDCLKCFPDGFFGNDDNYSCEKKQYSYVIRYGPIFASEIYHYLGHSQILEKNYNNKIINILSLGCGFAPDLLALQKYINDKQLSIQFEYTGIDITDSWNNIRISDDNAIYGTENVLSGFDLSDYDIIFVVKLYSALRKFGHHNKFMEILKKQITNKLKNGAFLIFDDFNSCNMGRDEFDEKISGLFSSKKYFYFNVGGAHHEASYESIPGLNNVFNIPDHLIISPEKEVKRDVIFEYRK